MKIIYQDMKKNAIKVVPETLDDLWHLSHIIEESDILSSKTTRRIQDTSGEKIRGDRGIKKTFTLGIEVKTISFHMFTGKLRATGVIISGPEDLIPLGTHHTIEIKINQPLKIVKEKWSSWGLKRLNQAVDASKKLSAIILVLEDDVADIGLIRQFGVEYYGPIIGNIPGKRIEQKNRKKQVLDFYDNIINSLNKFSDVQTILIAGPGFVKNDFNSYLSQKHSDLAKKIIIENTGTGGRVGIREVLQKGTLEKITAENRIALEIRAVNKLLGEISKNTGLVAYGEKEVKFAITSGAVNELLVLDVLVRDKEIEKVMDSVEYTNGEVLIVSSEHDAGKQLNALGGLAAILRYKLF